MGVIGIWQLLLILVLVLIIFGGSKMPELGRGLGLSLANFRKAIKETPNAKNESLDDKPNQQLKS